MKCLLITFACIFYWVVCLFLNGFIGIVCVFYTSFDRNMCVLAKTSKIGAGLKLVEGVIVEKQKENLRLLYYFHIFQKAKL